MVCAWKRLLSGSAYSFLHVGHSSKRDIDVFFLSYGKSLITENRAPQFVQFVNGNPNLRSFVLNISLIQSSHNAMSGGMDASFEPAMLLTIWKVSNIS